ncbi:pseudouridine synthase [Bradyrhizobium sp.]|uniref:pseudouridine synthase n=1 Tax=Bradyrhizobium sp. TaxID=376 RepID=UPI00262D815F|nr:pseudouridine synthase [Bradyrhizobium sp.]
MPRDNDKDNDSRGRRDRKPPGKGRSGVPRGPEKKFAKRSFGAKTEGERRPYAGNREDRPPRREDRDAPRARSDRPFADRPSRGKEGEKRSFRPRDDRGGEKRPYSPRGDRPPRREDRDAPRARSDRPFADRPSRGKEGEKRSFRPRDDRDGAKRSYTPRGEGFRKDGDRPRGDRPFAGRPERKFDEGTKFSRGPRKDFGSRPDRDREFGRDRGDVKPWRKRDDASPDRGGRNSGPTREGARNFDRPKFDKPRYDTPRDQDDRPRFSRPRDDRPEGGRPFRERPKFDRPRRDRNSEPGRPEGRTDWQEHPRSEGRSFRRDDDRPRRDNEDDSKVFAKRPAFGGRGAYRERDSDDRRPARPPKVKKSGERIAKVVSRAGLASRRDAEEWIVQGRVTVNGRVINSPALDVTENDVVTVDGAPLPPRERTRLFLYHKPRGLMTTHADPEGRPTVFDNLPEGLPRLISVGRLDFNTEGLLLLTNDGGLARALELPDTGWLRRYRVRAHGEVTQAQLDALKSGVEVDGVKYGPIEATLERDQGANVWLVFAIREGKNREVRNVMAHLGLEVNRLIRVSYGPFQLAELAEGAVEEVKTRVLREQLGEKIAILAGADFNRPMPGEAAVKSEDEAVDPPRGKKPFKPAGKSALIADSKGHRVLVRRTGSAEARARNEDEANGYGPPRRPKRGYHGKRDLKPRNE